MGLFSTEHHHHTSRIETKLVPYEKTVHEHKAPTDQSVKLLNEFQEKAKDNLIKTIKIDENHLKGVVMFYNDDFLQDRIHINYKFILNGKEYIIREHIDKFDWIEELRKGIPSEGDPKIIGLIYTIFSKAITVELLKASGSTLKQMIQ